MISGDFEKRYDKNCNSIYIWDDVQEIAYTFELTAHKPKGGECMPSTDISRQLDGVLKALAEALQKAGLIPLSATNAELKATKYHLEDMRKLALEEKP